MAEHLIIHTQFVQGLAHVIVGFAGSDDAKPGVGRGDSNLVHGIGGGILACGFEPMVVDATLHLQAVGSEQSRVEPMGERPVVDLEAWQDGLNAIRSDLDRA